jgi:2-hydroxy-6-oxonona-2,4-dienedioate hydrolase
MNGFATEVAGTRMHAVVLGEGPPVVLVHGFGISGAYMLPLARTLAPSFRTFVPDLPGQGESGELRGRPTLARLARALGRWVEANGLIRPAFVANSMGCQVVTELALKRPRLVGPMILVGPTIDPARRDAPGQLLAAFRGALREPFGVLAHAARDDARAGTRLLYSLGRSLLDDRIEDRLPSLEQQTVVMHGENDAFGSREWAERAASLLPNGRLLVAPGEPHSLHYTRPDLVAGIVGDLVVEEGEHRACEFAGRLEHGHVAARQQHEAGRGQGALPLVGEPVRDEVVAFAPDE